MIAMMTAVFLTTTIRSCSAHSFSPYELLRMTPYEFQTWMAWIEDDLAKASSQVVSLSLLAEQVQIAEQTIKDKYSLAGGGFVPSWLSGEVPSSTGEACFQSTVIHSVSPVQESWLCKHFAFLCTANSDRVSYLEQVQAARKSMDLEMTCMEWTTQASLNRTRWYEKELSRISQVAKLKFAVRKIAIQVFWVACFAYFGAILLKCDRGAEREEEYSGDADDQYYPPLYESEITALLRLHRARRFRGSVR